MSGRKDCYGQMNSCRLCSEWVGCSAAWRSAAHQCRRCGWKLTPSGLERECPGFHYVESGTDTPWVLATTPQREAVPATGTGKFYDPRTGKVYDLSAPPVTTAKYAAIKLNLSWRYCEHAPPPQLVEACRTRLDGPGAIEVPLVFSARMRQEYQRHEAAWKAGAVRFRVERELQPLAGPDLFGGVAEVVEGVALRCALCGGWVRKKGVV